ncbi:MAG: hypothetical protein ACUVTZ_01755 [Armatimonadota bacterium]
MEKGKRLRLAVPLLVLCAAVAVYTWRTLSARSQAHLDVLTANGTIEATEVDVSPKISGRIERLMVDEGDEVRAEQVIAVLEGAELKAQVEQAEGAYRTAQSKLADLLRGAREEDVRQARAALAQAIAAAEGS